MSILMEIVCIALVWLNVAVWITLAGLCVWLIGGLWIIAISWMFEVGRDLYLAIKSMNASRYEK